MLLSDINQNYVQFSFDPTVDRHACPLPFDQYGHSQRYVVPMGSRRTWHQISLRDRGPACQTPDYVPLQSKPCSGGPYHISFPLRGCHKWTPRHPSRKFSSTCLWRHSSWVHASGPERYSRTLSRSEHCGEPQCLLLKLLRLFAYFTNTRVVHQP